MHPDSLKAIIKQLRDIRLSLKKLELDVLKESTVDKTQTWYVLFILGILLLLIGCILYYVIWRTKRREIPSSGFFKSIDYIIAFTPTMKPGWHIFAGISVTVGLGLVIGYGIGIIIGKTEYDSHAMAIGVTSMVFSILLAVTSFWTLYQTKRLEHQQGYEIDNFEKLIKLMYDDLCLLEDDIERDDKVKEYHRVYFITEHPFFGTMSLRRSRVGRDFQTKLGHFVQHSIDKKVDFHILCGNDKCVSEFIENRFETKTGDEVKNAKERFEDDIKYFVDNNVATRKSVIPDYPQFMVIGKTIFEFILRPQEPRTAIISTQVHRDTLKCTLYIKTFNTLMKNLPN